MQSRSSIQPFKLVHCSSRSEQSSLGHQTRKAWEAHPLRVQPRMPFCPRSSDRFRAPPCEGGGRRCNSCRGRHLPLCLSSYRSGSVNRYSSVRVRPGDPFHGGRVESFLALQGFCRAIWFRFTLDKFLHQSQSSNVNPKQAADIACLRPD